MKLVCPVCQAEFPLEAAMNDVAARQAVVKAFELTEIGSLLIRYVSLFKPAKQALSMARLAKLLEELVPMVKSGQITRNGTMYPAPQTYWQQAIETVLAQREKLTLPMKSHGYLLEIIAGYANKASGQAERANEQGRKYGEYHTADKPAARNPVVAPAARKPKSTPPADWRAKVKKGASDGEENQA